jgi:hypothetical protein
VLDDPTRRRSRAYVNFMPYVEKIEFPLGLIASVGARRIDLLRGGAPCTDG